MNSLYLLKHRDIKNNICFNTKKSSNPEVRNHIQCVSIPFLNGLFSYTCKLSFMSVSVCCQLVVSISFLSESVLVSLLSVHIVVSVNLSLSVCCQCQLSVSVSLLSVSICNQCHFVVSVNFLSVFICC